MYLDGMLAEVTAEAGIAVEDTLVDLVAVGGDVVVKLEPLVFVVGARAAVGRVAVAGLVPRELVLLEVAARREGGARAQLALVGAVGGVAGGERLVVVVVPGGAAVLADHVAVTV
jgi:hypothetical protein